MCRALHTRIVALLEFGIADIWMRAHGSNDSPFHIASVLGICIDEWDTLAPYSGLFDASGRMKSTMWSRLLELEVDSRPCSTIGANGERENWMWFRFVGFPRKENPRSSRASSMISLAVELFSFMVLVLSATPSKEHLDKNNSSQTDA